jgi:hypothetical protein
MSRQVKLLASLSIVAAVAIGIGENASALAAQSSAASPIKVTNCQVLQAGPFRASGLELNYVNVATQAATKIKFFVDYRGQRNLVVDTGTFSPGVKISHQFNDFSGMVWEGPTPDHCRAVWVKFADGSLWQAPPPPQ